ncbi:MAG: glycosyltransferase [Candidatus Nanohaloarchaea archaeon]
MRIGFFSGVYFPRKDGACYTINSWKERLEREGHEVFVIYPDVEEYDPGENEIPVSSIPDPWYYGHRWPTPLGTRKFPELDIVHCHSPGLLGIMGRYYAWKKNLPSLFTFHSPLEEYAEGLFPSKIASKIFKTIFVSADEFYLSTFDAVTTNTGDIRNRDIDPVELPAGIDMEFFRPREESFLEEMDLERPIAGYSGRLSEEKNIEHIIEMAEGFDGALVIVGNGRNEKKLKQMGGEDVIFMDYLEREKLPEFYSGLDVFVHASEADTFSLSSLEANACGTSVVAPSVRPFTQVISEEAGELYGFGRIEEFRVKVEKAASGQYDCRKAVERYSLEKTVERLQEMYSDLEDAS